MVEMNGGPEKCAFPSVSLSVAMPKVDPRFGTGAQADSGANGHPSFWLREAIQRERRERGGKLLWALSLLQRPTRASSRGGLNLEMLDHDSIKQDKFFSLGL